MSLVRPIANKQQHEQEADRAGTLDDGERHAAAADLLDQAPEDVAAVERQEREQVDQAEREADHGENEDPLVGVEADRLIERLRAADHARDLLPLRRARRSGRSPRASAR